jgi:DNA-binding transcriptional MerR regulator
VSEQQYTRIVLHNNYATSYHSEQETAEFCHLEVQIIRQLRDAGVIRGVDVAGEGQRYGNEELALLRRVRRLHYDLGINIEGVEVILRLYERLEALQREVEQYRREKGI